MAVKTFITGEKLTASDTNTYLNNGGLVYVGAASNNGTASLALDSCFSATYDNYRIEGVISSGTGLYYANLRTGAGNDTAGTYKWGRMYARWDNASTGVVGTLSDSIWTIGESGSIGASLIIFDVISPYLAQKTFYSTQIYPTVQTSTGDSYIGYASGVKDNTTQYTGIAIRNNSNSNFTATFRVYGYRQA